MSTEEKQTSKTDLQHFLQLACAQVRHRLKQTETQDSSPERRSLQLLEDLIKEQVQSK